jgi:hypothetical protein
MRSLFQHFHFTIISVCASFSATGTCGFHSHGVNFYSSCFRAVYYTDIVIALSENLSGGVQQTGRAAGGCAIRWARRGCAREGSQSGFFSRATQCARGGGRAGTMRSSCERGRPVNPRPSPALFPDRPSSSEYITLTQPQSPFVFRVACRLSGPPDLIVRIIVLKYLKQKIQSMLYLMRCSFPCGQKEKYYSRSTRIASSLALHTVRDYDPSMNPSGGAGGFRALLHYHRHLSYFLCLCLDRSSLFCRDRYPGREGKKFGGSENRYAGRERPGGRDDDRYSPPCI